MNLLQSKIYWTEEVSLTIIATTTESHEVLTAIHQILNGFQDAILPRSIFRGGYINDLKLEHLMVCFKKLNDTKKKIK